MTQNTEQERAVFEAHFNHLDLTKEPDAWGVPRYKQAAIWLAWEVWQAAHHAHHTQAKKEGANNMGHVHAAAMAEYAKDATETDMPWKRWEVTTHRGAWVALFGHPYWKEESEYRRKPKVILINGYEVPEPHRVPLEIYDVYWTFTFVGGVINLYWSDDSECRNALKNGFVHLTKEAAEKHYEAIKSFTAQKE